MAEISKITLPSGNTYDLKDATAREMIAGGISYIVAYKGDSAPVVSDIPKGVKVTYNNTTYTGTLEADDATLGAFYLVRSATQVGTLDVYDEYVVAEIDGTMTWEKLGDTQLNLTNVVMDVTLNKTTDVVLGEATTFTNASSSVSFSGGTNDKVLGADTKFSVTEPTINVSPTKTYIKGTASGGGASWNSKDQKSVVTGYTPTKESFVKSVSADTTKKLVTTTVPNVTGNSNVSIPNVTGNSEVTIPNVTNAGSASTWDFKMGTGANAETLIISGGNSVAPTLGTALKASKVTLGTALSASKVTLGTAKTVATGVTSTTGTGDAVVTDVTIGDSAEALTGLGTPATANVIGASSTFTNTQPTIALATDSASATGRVQVMTGASATASGTAITASGDEVTAITSIGTATAAAQKITVGTNDKVTVLKSDTSIAVTKGTSSGGDADTQPGTSES